ncbi:HAD family hydrolase [Halorhabdus sp. CBA1104]|uniref:HAD family hydrolase n=1 Tax=Halorhabdus sp. CBA1104 TaxID=1380432 RepID=UPI0012B2EF6E|nr:HAD family hydrolase [Halorhabdus sp. CBA1104]QGN06105.1 HAD family hydrolase [Halorhabdus sp. CBA1104]
MSRPPEYDFWLFDLDGTLVDVEGDYPQQVFDRVGERLDYDFDEREIRVLWHGLTGSRNDQLREWGLDPDQFWPAYHEIEDPTARAQAAYLYDDARELLSTIDAPTGIVTHSQPYLTGPTLETLGLGEQFDAVVCCDGDLGWKPDPAPVERAMGDLGVDTNGHAGVMVGDSPHDVRAAHNAGLDGIHVERFDGTDRPGDIDGEQHVKRLDELL